MENEVSKKRPPPFTMRLSEDERSIANARAEAAGLSVAGYFKAAALGSSPRTFKRPQVDRELLAKLLNQIARVGNNVNQLARTMHMEGSIELPELQQALKDVSQMRNATMSALGYRESDDELTPDHEANVHDY